ALLSGSEADDDIDEYTMYPETVVKLMARDPYLANVIVKKNLPSRPVETIADLRRVNKTMSEVISILDNKNNAQRAKLTADAVKFLKQSRQLVSDEFGYPLLGDIEGDHFGLPKGTRLIVTFASITHMLLIAKVGADYKIIYAGVGSPD
ncbi:MAG: hypothetical protein ACRD6X_22440, partial [Pyrinomonadaceae bacterium]